MLFLMMGFISLVDEIQFMLISSRHICIRSIAVIECSVLFLSSGQVIFDSLFGTTSNAKLRVYAVQFVHHVCLCSSDKVLSTIGPMLLSGMNKLIAEKKEVGVTR